VTMGLKSNERRRKGVLFGFTTVATAMALGATAFACVVPKGQMTVTVDPVGSATPHGHTVVGLGASLNDPLRPGQIFEYCSTGRPTTAAAGHLHDTVKVKVEPATCNDPGAPAGTHLMEAGLYDVSYNHMVTHTYDGTNWNWEGVGTGCYRRAGSTSHTMGYMTVDATGNGSWTGPIDPAGTVTNGPTAPDFFSAGPVGVGSTAGSICVGAEIDDPSDPGDARSTSAGYLQRDGMIAPFRLLGI